MMKWKEFAKRLVIKLTSRKFWGFALTIGLVIFVGYAGTWALAVDLGKIIVPVALAALTGAIAYEKGKVKAGDA
jgi:UPF0716 family protein affecting phage T7 exclusion